MVGDKIHIRPEYYATAQHIITPLLVKLSELNGGLMRKVVLIGGESGSGKSVLAVTLSEILEQNGYPNTILHLDDYFKLPPATNHQNRLRSLENVGVQEVDLALLQSHLMSFKNGELSIEKPVSDYQNDHIFYQNHRFNDAKILIIEGTYALFLQNANFRIFIERTYLDTLPSRIARGRDVIDEFGERVLEIEHSAVQASVEAIDVRVTKLFGVVSC
jgi:uridine kinase